MFLKMVYMYFCTICLHFGNFWFKQSLECFAFCILHSLCNKTQVAHMDSGLQLLFSLISQPDPTGMIKRAFQKGLMWRSSSQKCTLHSLFLKLIYKEYRG